MEINKVKLSVYVFSEKTCYTEAHLIYDITNNRFVNDDAITIAKDIITTTDETDDWKNFEVVTTEDHKKLFAAFEEVMEDRDFSALIECKGFLINNKYYIQKI